MGTSGIRLDNLHFKHFVKYSNLNSWLTFWTKSSKWRLSKKWGRVTPTRCSVGYLFVKVCKMGDKKNSMMRRCSVDNILIHHYFGVKLTKRSLIIIRPRRPCSEQKLRDFRPPYLTKNLSIREY